MRIIVTGGAGFIGSVLVPKLLKEGHEVTVIDNLTWGMQGLSVNFDKPNFKLVKGDIRNDELISGLLENTDVVVHLAALVGHVLCESNKKQATDVNVNGSRTIDKYLSDNQLLIFASTASVYGQANGSSCTEKTATDPPSHYAITKLEAEKIFSKRKNVVTLRFATTFGASFRMRLDLLVNQFVYEAIKNKVLVVYGKNVRRSVIHVQDAVRSIIFAVHNRESMQGQMFNVSSSESTFTKEQIAQHIKKQVDYDLQFAGSNFDLDRRNYQLSPHKIEELGYHANVSLDQGIMELIHGINMLKIEKTYFNS